MFDSEEEEEKEETEKAEEIENAKETEKAKETDQTEGTEQTEPPAPDIPLAYRLADIFIVCNKNAKQKNKAKNVSLVDQGQPTDGGYDSDVDVD